MTRTLFEYPNVVGFGRGMKWKAGRETILPATVVLVERKLERSALAAEELIPRAIDGTPTDVREVGHLRALAARTDAWRPAPGGVSIGHRDITAGTLGCLVRDAVGGRLLILSNNHVLANSNAGKVGDPVYQPGPYDGGTEAIAWLERWTPIVFEEGPGGCWLAGAAAAAANALARLVGSGHRLRAVRQATGANLYDAAVAAPLSESLVSPDILGLRAPLGVAEKIAPGAILWKSGRTTEVTSGRAEVVDATVDVDYGGGRKARFEGQVVTGAGMSQGGDSGSAVLDEASRLAGLLFGGSDQATVISPIGPVLAGLELTL